MTLRSLATGLFAVLLLVAAHGLAFAVDCATCSRNLTDCQKPAHASYVSCMKGSDSSCGAKCASDCRGKSEIQKCTLDCTKACQGGTSCQKTFSTASAQCISTYKTCKNGCTASR